MKFTITFHNGFRVATGHARLGVDATVDPDNLVPASALKGLMRASARLLLPMPDEREHPLITTIFGGTRQPCPWNWSGAEPAETPVVRTRGRVAIDGTTGTAVRDALRFDEEAWTRTATFEVTQIDNVDDVARHALVLSAAAQGVHALGSDRRRGLGWVTIRSVDVPVDADAIQALLTLRTREAGGQHG